MPEKEFPMKNFLKTLLALTLVTTLLLAGCEKKKDEWQTVFCDVPVYEGHVFRDGEKLTYGESRDIDGTQSISFKLPNGYYQTENTGDYETEKTWTNGNTTVAVFGVKLVDAKEYFEYCEYIHPYLRTTSGREIVITSLNNGVIESYYPSDETEKSTTHIHFVDATLGEYVIRFTVYEHCPKDSPAISDETIEFIQTIANSFECTAEMVMNEPAISAEDLALAEKAAVDFGVLHNAGIWESAEEIGPHRFYLWYVDYIASITTYEERLERYTHENYEVGWSYQQEEFEAYMQKCFDVSIEHLRSDEYCYHAEDGIYNLEYVAAPNLRYKVRLAEELPTVDGDMMYIPIELSFEGDFLDTEYRTLVIQKTEDGFKYLKSEFTTEKVDFSGFSMHVPKDMRVKDNSIYYWELDNNKNIEIIKLLNVQSGDGAASLLSYAEKEYKESEFFVKEFTYDSDDIRWNEYILKIPLPEESGLDQTETYSYYVISVGDKTILMEARTLIYGPNGNYREEVENILKTIE